MKPNREAAASRVFNRFTPEQRQAFWTIVDALDAEDRAAQRIPLQAKANGQTKVCLVGFVPTYWRTVPWKDESWERWGCNGLYRLAPVSRFTRWFELHAKGKDLGQRGWREPQDELLAISERMPLYLTRKEREIPKGVPYPLKDVEKLTPWGAYHAGSFDYMLALAILLGFKEIRLTGVDFQSGGEPLSARPCLEYWLGVAMGRGITVTVEAGDVGRIFRLVRSDEQYGFDPFRLVEDR